MSATLRTLPTLLLAAALPASAATLPRAVTSPAFRASCPQIVQGPPCQEFWRADAVFVGYVTEAVGVRWPNGIVGWTQYSKLTARLAVEETFRGDVGTEITFVTDDCPYHFKEGERYLVYAGRGRDGKLYQRAGYSRTQPLSEAGEDMAYIRGLSQAGSGGRIFGTVSQDNSDYRLRAAPDANDLGRGGGTPSGVRVVVEGQGQSYEAKTDGGGRFEFSGLPAGEYRVRAETAAGHARADVEKISLPNRGCAPVRVHVVPEGEIFGRVTSAAGRPVKDARVMLFSAEGVTPEGLARLEDAPPVMTFSDGQGRYHFGRLPAGRYYVAVSVPLGEGPNKTYLRTFFPNVAGIDEATAITLAEGQKKAGADVQLPTQ